MLAVLQGMDGGVEVLMLLAQLGDAHPQHHVLIGRRIVVIHAKDAPFAATAIPDCEIPPERLRRQYTIQPEP